MGTDNYTKEEREFYESIMQEIRSHQDFGKRNPVDIGIECGYSEDDVMGMIYMCQDIVGEKQTQEPVPMREDWDLEGIIPFEDFMKIDFPSTAECDNHPLDTLWCDTVCKIGGLNCVFISSALQRCEEMRTRSLKEIFENTFEYCAPMVIKGFKHLTKWISLYSMVAATVFENRNICIPLADDDEIDAVKNLIHEEIKAGEFHPIDMIVIKENGWDKKLEIQ